MTWLTVTEVSEKMKCRRESIMRRIKTGKQKARMNTDGPLRFWEIREDQIVKPQPIGRPRKIKS